MNYNYLHIRETNKDDVKFNLLSVLAAAKLGKDLEALVRWDSALDPTPSAQDSYIIMAKGFKTDVFIAGLSWKIHPKIEIVPNIKVVTYKENRGFKPDTDTYAIVTFFYQF